VKRSQYLRRSLQHYWRTHLAVVAGVAVAVAVLCGALLVGHSVRTTLRDLALGRLGRIDVAVHAGSFADESLAVSLAREPALRAAADRVAPAIVRDGLITAQRANRRVGGVQVYGVNDAFWALQGVAPPSGWDQGRALVSAALARDLSVQAGEALLVRVERPSAVPLESIQADRDAVGRTIRVTVGEVSGARGVGEFSLRAGQGDVRAMFLPLQQLQRELGVAGRVNTLLVASGDGPSGAAAKRAAAALETTTRLSDFGLRVTTDDDRELRLDSSAGLIPREVEQAATSAAVQVGGLDASGVLTYLANTIESHGHQIPYSLVTGTRLLDVWKDAERSHVANPMVLTDWAARDLRARVGSRVTLEYFVWVEPGRLETRAADFVVATIIPIRPKDRDLAPAYAGITDAETVAEWDPPFPIDLRRIRPLDEAYWHRYRTTPKAYIRLEDAQRLWASRYGAVTSMRFRPSDGVQREPVAPEPLAATLRAALSPWTLGVSVRDVRTEALASSRGATDFGQYFVYFSFFLVVSAVVLAALFFRFGVEQRAQEVGLLRALGGSARMVRRLFLTEAATLAAVGAVVGALGGVVYAWLVIHALSTWWVDAVRTTELTLHFRWQAVAWGVILGGTAALVCTAVTVRGLNRVSERSLLTIGAAATVRQATARLNPMRPLVASVLCAIFGGTFVLGGVFEVVSASVAFFLAGVVLLLSALFLCAYVYQRPGRRVLKGRGLPALAWLGWRNAADRPGRSVLALSVIASAVFMLVAVDAFRREPLDSAHLPPGAGGYRLFAESLLPITEDLQDPRVRDSLGLAGLQDVTIEPMRLRPGDDASCLNLYQPSRPRVLGVRPSFVAQNRFAFHDSLAVDAADVSNPWRLLEKPLADGAIPAIADANSLAYVLHRSVGQDLVIDTGGAPLRLRFVAALVDSVFQSEIIVGDASFVKWFGDLPGYRAMLVELPAGQEAKVSDQLEDALSDHGLDAISTVARLDDYHRVENTYLSTFQTLGGLGLLLGTLGLGAVVLRNVLERRRELALLSAVGYQPRDIMVTLLAETGSMLMTGMLVGAGAAGLAIAPAVLARDGHALGMSHAVLLVTAVALCGIATTVLATRLATAGSLLESLKSE
jgi:putative ABC transport system permease protein